MLVIKPHQVRALRHETLADFKRDACRLLRGPRPTPGPFQPLTDAQLRELVDEGTDTALAYGFLARDHVLAFIECTWLHGSQFHRRAPWAQAILRDDTASPEDKLARLRAGEPGRATRSAEGAPSCG